MMKKMIRNFKKYLLLIILRMINKILNKKSNKNKYLIPMKVIKSVYIICIKCISEKNEEMC